MNVQLHAVVRFLLTPPDSTPTKRSEAAEGTENLERLQRLLENVLDSLWHHVWAKSAPGGMESKQLLGEYAEIMIRSLLPFLGAFKRIPATCNASSWLGVIAFLCLPGSLLWLVVLGPALLRPCFLSPFCFARWLFVCLGSCWPPVPDRGPLLTKPYKHSQKSTVKSPFRFLINRQKSVASVWKANVGQRRAITFCGVLQSCKLQELM